VEEPAPGATGDERLGLKAAGDEELPTVASVDIVILLAGPDGVLPGNGKEDVPPITGKLDELANGEVI
jgi:hypothetical protein